MRCAGIKVDKGLVPMVNSNNESWCQGLDGLAQRTAEYYKAGARFAKWRGVVSIPAGPSMIALRDTAYGLARYAAIAQVGILPLSYLCSMLCAAGGGVFSDISCCEAAAGDCGSHYCGSGNFMHSWAPFSALLW